MILALLCAVGIILQGVFITVEHKEKYTAAVIFKGLASLCFIGAGFAASANVENHQFASLIKAGLIMGGIGDVLLNLRFVLKKIGSKVFLVGILAFLAGHILYLLAILPLSANVLPCVIAGVVAAALLLWWIFSNIQAKPVFKAFGVVYLGAIVLMTSVAIGNLISNPSSVNALLYVIGAVLFTASDVVLIFNTFGSKQRFSMRIANLSLYYAGQLLIALSLLFI